MAKLSVIIPVYNEKATVLELIRRVKEVRHDKEIVIVNDGSTDGTAELLRGISDPEIKVFHHEKNRGKGAAVRTGIVQTTGDYIIIQDADLEYNPADYPALLAPLESGIADVVYGTRFLGGTHRVLLFWHYFGNVIFTLITNVLYNINLSDMGTCYKVFRANALKSLQLKSDGFGFEPEVTAKICKKKLRIFETPISYSGRTYEEGKKITWKDGLVYLWTLIKFRLTD